MKIKSRWVVIPAFSLLLSLSLFTKAISQVQNSAALSRSEGPCDIYAAAGCPCVTAHSTTRALYKSYNGPLYQVMRQSDGKTLDIGLVTTAPGDAGGYADAAAQDAFLAGTIGWISKIYDQSGKGNHLVQAPPGTFRGPAKGGFNNLPIADMAPVTINGHKAYGAYFMPGMGLRNNNSTGIPINDEPEGIYYVINGKHYSSGCCFDYGNSSTNSRAVGTGTMETTYYGTATAWGSGNGTGPWIMADMEAGLFSGYNVKKNDVPSIDSWQFVSAFVDGGGGNKWDLRGGNAQQGKLTTFYSGVRPRTPESDAYYPMNKKGAVLLGNGGDNGNGSAGTFYEGVMTKGFPNEATTDAVQANIVAAKYDVQRVNLSRITTFTPQSAQDVTLTFTNTTGAPATGVKLSIATPKGWTALVQGSTSTTKTFADPIAPGSTVSEVFKITSPATTDAGFVTGKAEWKSSGNNAAQSSVIQQRVRNVHPVKINEVRFNTGTHPADQFIELYNGSSAEADISNWTIINTQSEWAPVTLGKIPAGTKLAPHGFYLLGLSASGLVAPARQGDNVINVRSVAGLKAGQQIHVGGESQTITKIGTAASPMTTVFVPVSTGPWLTVPAGSANLPVTNATGFAVGEKIGIDMGGNYEIATVTAVGKAATQTNLAVAAKAGETTIKVTDNANMTVGDELIISTGSQKEIVKVKRIVNVVTAPVRGFGQGGNNEPGEVELTAALKFNHMKDVDVSDRGTGISFSPATRFAHKSGDAVQALGSGITLTGKLSKSHETGTAIISAGNTTEGYRGSVAPDQWYGLPLSVTAGSIALMDASGKALVDGMVYGSQQSNSSANGTIASPEIATLEGDQHQGGCIVVVPNPGRGFVQTTISQTDKSYGRFPDGADNDNNCSDFQTQHSVTLALASAAGSNNIKVSGTGNFGPGKRIVIGTGPDSETATIATVGTPGGTTIGSATAAGATIISVGSAQGFTAGQSITIGTGSGQETAVIASVSVVRRRFGGNRANQPTDSITVTAPLKNAHAAEAQVSGTGITLTASLSKAHDSAAQVAGSIPTPGKPNQYEGKLD